MICPHDGDEEVAHRIAQPHRPERHQCSKGRNLRGAQIQDEHRYENGEHPVGERGQPLSRSFRLWHEYQPNVPIQVATARPISSGESSWTK